MNWVDLVNVATLRPEKHLDVLDSAVGDCMLLTDHDPSCCGAQRVLLVLRSLTPGSLTSACLFLAQSTALCWSSALLDVGACCCLRGMTLGHGKGGVGPLLQADVRSG